MASVSHLPLSMVVLLVALLASAATAQLSSTFYDSSCPNALSTIRSAVTAAVNNEPRMGASLLRLHFHDCFVDARLRRVGVAERHGHLHRGADCNSEQGLAPRLHRHRQHQGAGGGRVQSDRVLRRHPRRRCPGFCRRAGRAVVDCSFREKRLHNCKQGQCRKGPACSYFRSRQSHSCVRQQEPQRHGPCCSLWGSHDRAVSVPVLQGQDLQRDQHQLDVRGVAQGQLPPGVRQRRQQPGAAGRDVAYILRQRLLHQPALPAGAAALRPAAVQRRRQHRQHGPELRVQLGRLQQRLHGGDDQHGEYQPQDGLPRGDQAQLLQGQLLTRATLVQQKHSTVAIRTSRIRSQTLSTAVLCENFSVCVSEHRIEICK